MSEKKQEKKLPKTLFVDEKEAYAKMLEDGFSSENALEVIANRRSKMAPKGTTTHEDLKRLKELAEEGMDSSSAVKQVFKERREREYQALPWYKKIGKNVFDLGVGGLKKGVQMGGNTYDFAQGLFTGEKSEIGKSVDEIEKTVDRITGGSTASQVGEITAEIGTLAFGGGALKKGGDLALKIPGATKVASTVSKVPGVTQAGNIISKGSNFIASKIPSGTGLGATFTRNAIYGGGYGALDQIFKNGSDTKMEQIVESAAIGAGVGGLLGVGIEKIALPGIKKALGYADDIKNGNFSKVGQDIKEDLGKFGENLKDGAKNIFKNQELASSISTKVNRFKKSDIEKFTKMTGETPGEWAINRGMTSTGDDAVEEAVKFYRKSMKEADKGFESIIGKFKDDGDDYIGIMISDLAERLEKTSAGKVKTDEIKNIFQKYRTEGLTMTEINQIKREYAKNFKYSWVDNASESALRSTNLQNGVREWQFKLANENGFTNLAEINKNTQGWKAYADMLGSEVAGKQGNNTISLTDWVSLSGGNPTNISMFLGKQVGKLPKVQRSAMKFFGKQTKNPILEAQVSKVDDLIENISSKKVNFGKSGEKIINQKIPTTGSQVASQDVLKIRNNLENVAEKYDVDLSDISLTNNEFRNSLNILSKVNSKIPKGTGKQTDLSKQMYQEKIDNIIELIKFVKNEKNLGNLNITYKWDYDKKINMPYILFKEGKFFKSYHVKEKYMKKIKAIVK